MLINIRTICLNIKFIIVSWITKIILPLLLSIFIELKNVIEVFVIKNPHQKIFNSGAYYINNMNEKDCDKQLTDILNVLDGLPGQAIEIFLSDLFVGRRMKDISLRDLDNAIKKYMRCGFKQTKRILKMVHKHGHYLDTKAYTDDVCFIDVDEPLDRFYRPCAIQIIRDFAYIGNSIVSCLLGYSVEVTDDDVVIWEKFYSNLRPTLLVLPSTYGFNMMYYPVIKLMEKTHNILYIDAPNVQLRSGKVINVETLINNVDAIIKKKHLSEIHYMGHSFGCMIINHVLERNKSLITKIVLIEPPIMLGLNSRMMYDKQYKLPHKLMQTDTKEDHCANDKVSYQQYNSFVSAFYRTVFKADHTVLNMIKSFGHVYNIFPKKALLDMMKHNDVVIVLSRDDVLIDYKTNNIIYKALGAVVIESDTHHGMSIIDTHIITEIVKILQSSIKLSHN